MTCHRFGIFPRGTRAAGQERLDAWAQIRETVLGFMIAKFEFASVKLPTHQFMPRAILVRDSKWKIYLTSPCESNRVSYHSRVPTFQAVYHEIWRADYSSTNFELQKRETETKLQFCVALRSRQVSAKSFGVPKRR